MASSELAWQKMLAIVTEADVTAVPRGNSSSMAFDLNHDLFRVMCRTRAFYSRLSSTEKALHNERLKSEGLARDLDTRTKELEAKYKKALTQVEEANDNVAIAQLEKDEVVRANKAIKEENKKLANERNGVWRELTEATGEKERLGEEVAELKKKLEDARSAAVAEYKDSLEYQQVLYPVFLQGFNNAKALVKADFEPSFPGLDVSALEPREIEEEVAKEKVVEQGEGGSGTGGGESLVGVDPSARAAEDRVTPTEGVGQSS